MKHNFKITLFLILIFFLAQIVGLNVISQYVNIKQTSEGEVTVVNDLGEGLTPSDDMLAKKAFSINDIWVAVYLIFLILVGTAILLLLIKFKFHNLWKIWFSLAVMLALYKASFPFLTFLDYFGINVMYAAIAVAALITLLRNKQTWLHNFSELLLYGGIASIFVPMLNLFSVFLILLLISAYDIYAVFKSKHMVKLANYQTENQVFAGIDIPYTDKAILVSYGPQSSSENNIASTSAKSSKTVSSNKSSSNSTHSAHSKDSKTSTHIHHAILGGGDLAFPLIFAGVVLKYSANYLAGFTIAVFATISLALLLFFAKKGKFYPAMPFLSAGCLVGFLVTLLY